MTTESLITIDRTNYNNYSSPISSKFDPSPDWIINNNESNLIKKPKNNLIKNDSVCAISATKKTELSNQIASMTLTGKSTSNAAIMPTNIVVI